MKIQVDKVAHFGLSGMMTLAAQVFVSLWLAAAIVFVIGIVKEIYDGAEHNVFSIADIAFNILGIIATVLVCRIM